MAVAYSTYPSVSDALKVALSGEQPVVGRVAFATLAKACILAIYRFLLTAEVRAIVIPLAVLIAITGPIGLYDRFVVAERFAIVGGAMLFLALIGPMLGGFAVAFCLRLRINVSYATLLTTLLLAALLMLCAHLVASGAPRAELSPAMLRDGVVLAILLLTVSYVLTLMMRPSLGRWLIDSGVPVARVSRPATAPAPVASPAAEAAPAPLLPVVPLLEQVPQEKRGALLHIQAQNQYVLVRTSAGESLLRMRFHEALEEAQPEPGLVVHRSHWVAQNAVDGLERDGRRKLLRLSDGSTVPISRERLPDVLAEIDVAESDDVPSA
ncbi:MAG: LytTR family DNA-binding domain-containing protein [Pseudomonadota bacterium]